MFRDVIRNDVISRIQAGYLRDRRVEHRVIARGLTSFLQGNWIRDDTIVRPPMGGSFRFARRASAVSTNYSPGNKVVADGTGVCSRHLNGEPTRMSTQKGNKMKEKSARGPDSQGRAQKKEANDEASYRFRHFPPVDAPSLPEQKELTLIEKKTTCIWRL